MPRKSVTKPGPTKSKCKPKRKRSSSARPSNEGGIHEAPVETVPFDQVKAAPYNPRVDLQPGDEAWQRLERGMLDLGFVGGMVWNRRTGNLVGGHQRLKVLQHHSHTEAQMSVVDLAPEREKALNVLLNNPEAAGDWDPRKLADLVAELDADDSIDALLTGYDAEQIDAIMDDAVKALAPGSDQESGVGGQGLDDKDGKPIGSAFGVLVTCKSEKDQRKLYDQMTQAGRKCRCMMI